MELNPLGVEGAWVAESPVWGDERGFFREWFKNSDISRVTGRDFSVAQANISSSARGVVRGIHYSLAEGGQAKWVTCVSGSIRDVIVDIRPSSPTYGKSVVVALSSASGNAVFIGEGLGHAFVSLEDSSTVAYLVSSPFSPSEEFEINPLDPEIGIEWGFPVEDLRLSPKDASAPSLKDRNLEGKLPK
jgi:dTDP-4-dehydrorhamnose 3,5-epimerase